MNSKKKKKNQPTKKPAHAELWRKSELHERIKESSDADSFQQLLE